MTSYTYAINSASRRTPLSTSSTNFTLYLPQPLVADSKVQLLSANVPVTCYNVTTANNLIDFKDNNGTLVATITPGAYTSTSLCAAILTALNAASNNYLTVTYNSDTLFVTVTRTGNFQLLGATGANPTRSLLPQLGFVTDTASAATATATRAYQVNQPYNIYCCVSEMGYEGTTSYGIPYTFVLTLTTNTNGISLWTLGGFYEQMVRLSRRISATSLSIRLVYETGQDLDLNGADWQMVFGTQ